MSGLIMPGVGGIAGPQQIPVTAVYPVGLPGRKWNMDVQLYTKSTDIPRVANCFAFMVTNTGADIFRFNGLIFYPGVPGTSLGDSRTLSGHLLDEYAGNLTVVFAATTAPECEVTQLYYIM